tara:strand:- start:2016 stop:2990 length:975 start_codon:yes stop_codon:yes gene_type:complete
MINNLLKTKSNWLSWEGVSTELNVSNYPLHSHTPKSLSEALQLQAQEIFDDFKDYTLVCSLSGGIDSHQMAYGFAEAGLPVKYVYFKTSFMGRPEKELIFVEEFAAKYNLEVDIIETDFSVEDVRHLVTKHKYFADGLATVACILFDPLYEKYIETNPNSLFILSTIAHFFYLRDKNTCFGKVITEQGFLNEIAFKGYKIPFNFYSTHLWQYYEYLHKKDLIMQFHKKFQPKHLAFTELGFPLREKIGQCDWFSESFHEPVERTTINFANDKVLLNNNKGNFLNLFSYSSAKINNVIRRTSVIQKKEVTTTLYSFETDVDRYDL